MNSVMVSSFSYELVIENVFTAEISSFLSISFYRIIIILIKQANYKVDKERKLLCM
jgi:hypothetical protein